MDDFCRCLLVGRIGVGEQKTHRDGFDALRHQLARGRGNLVGIERLDHVTGKIEPLAHLVDAVAGQQHFRRRCKDVEHLVAAPLPADLIDVAETAGGDQADPRALAFEHGVERRGRAVQDQRYRVGAEFGGEIAGDLLHHRGRLRRIGRVFADGDQRGRIFVEGGDVGESAADVDADTQFHEAALDSDLARSFAVASASTLKSSLKATP